MTASLIAVIGATGRLGGRVARHMTFADATAAAGVEHLAYVSFYGAAPDSTFMLARDHYATEQDIRASGVSITFLRYSRYSDFMTAMARTVVRASTRSLT